MDRKKVAVAAAAALGAGGLLYYLLRGKEEGSAVRGQLSLAECARRRELIKGAVTYKLELAFSPKEDFFRGAVDIAFELTEAEQLTLDFHGQKLDALSVNGQELSAEQRAPAFGQIALSKLWLRKGANAVTARFTSAFDAGAEGLARARLGTETFVRLLAPAARVFPCFDQPSLKACVRLRLLLPQAWQAFSNEKPAAMATSATEFFAALPPDNRRELSFLTTKKLSLDAFTLAAGHFCARKAPAACQGVAVEFFFRAAAEARLNERAEALLQCIGETLRFFKEKLKSRYAFSKLDVCFAGAAEERRGLPGVLWLDEGVLRAPASAFEAAEQWADVAAAVAQVWLGGVTSAPSADACFWRQALPAFLGWLVYAGAAERLSLHALDADVFAMLRNTRESLVLAGLPSTPAVVDSFEYAEEGAPALTAVSARRGQAYLHYLHGLFGAEPLLAAVKHCLEARSWDCVDFAFFAQALPEGPRAAARALFPKRGLDRFELRRAGGELRVTAAAGAYAWERVTLVEYLHGEAPDKVVTPVVLAPDARLALHPQHAFYLLNPGFSGFFVYGDSADNARAVIANFHRLSPQHLLSYYLNLGHALLCAGTHWELFHELTLKLLSLFNVAEAGGAPLELVVEVFGRFADAAQKARFGPSVFEALLVCRAFSAALRVAATPAQLERLEASFNLLGAAEAEELLLRLAGAAGERAAVERLEARLTARAPLSAQLRRLKEALGDEQRLRAEWERVCRNAEEAPLAERAAALAALARCGSAKAQAWLCDAFCDGFAALAAAHPPEFVRAVALAVLPAQRCEGAARLAAKLEKLIAAAGRHPQLRRVLVERRELLLFHNGQPG